MATYAIGDLQGCYKPFQQLLEIIKFDPADDQLWLAGDLVNRGPDSLSTLRFVYQHRHCIHTVLGNHDLHLLALSEGVRQMDDPGLQDIVNAPDADELLDWLRHQPLLHYDKQIKTVMVHAGISPQWTLKQARQYAKELEEVLGGDKYKKFLNHMYGNEPNAWHEDLKKWDRLRYITNSFTRMRYVDAQGNLDLKQNGSIGSQPKHLTPWFTLKARKPIKARVLFGHWSTLGPFQIDNYYCLDSGCVWGGQLTALKIDGEVPQWLSIPCHEARSPI